MAEKKRIEYTEWNEPHIVCPPEGGFPLERLRDYLEMAREQKAFKPEQVCDMTQLLCDDDLLGSLDSGDREFIANKLRPNLNAYLQREGRRVRVDRELRRSAN